MRVLLADDDPLLRKLLERLLGKLGHDVVFAENGREAIEILNRDTSISLLVTDWTMPEVDGIEVCRFARGMPRDRYLPVILLTARTNKEELVQGLNAGADAFCSKPVDFAELTAHIRVAERILMLEEQLADELRCLKAAHEQLALAKTRIEEIARTDELTGLDNRRSVMDALALEISRSERYRTPLSIAIMDIDHFKVVNDRHGHPAGDLVLKAVSGTLKKALRTSDVVGRYGGEEFLAVLPETGLEQGAAVVERLRGWVSALKIQLDSGKSVEITVSAGVAQYAFAGDSRDLFLKRADAALYRAKDSGRNRVETEPVSPDGRQPDE